MSSSQAGPPDPDMVTAQQVARAAVALRSMGEPNSFARRFDFWDTRYEWQRIAAELLGTFLLVFVAVGGGMVNARLGGVPAGRACGRSRPHGDGRHPVHGRGQRCSP